MSQLVPKARLLRRVRRAVVKVGSNVLAGPNGLRRDRVRMIAAEIAVLAAGGRQIVVVSSGAVAVSAPAGVASSGGRRRPPSVRSVSWRRTSAPSRRTAVTWPRCC